MSSGVCGQPGRGRMTDGPDALPRRTPGNGGRRQIDGPAILSGMGVTLGPSIFGFLILGIAAVAWLALQWGAGRSSRLEAQMYTGHDIL